MQAAARYAAGLTLFAAEVQQAREPRQRHADHTSIGQRHPEIVVVERTLTGLGEEAPLRPFDRLAGYLD
jgi:hypothetical protein